MAEEKARADAEYEFKQRRIMGAGEEVRLARKEHELARAKDRKAYEMDRRIETEARFAAATARRDARTRADARAREGRSRATRAAEYDADVALLTAKKTEETEETLRRKRDAVARGASAGEARGGESRGRSRRARQDVGRDGELEGWRVERHGGTTDAGLSHIGSAEGARGGHEGA